MKITITTGGKNLSLEVAACCAENSFYPVTSRPDLKQTVNKDYRFCDKCGRQWKNCITYAGASLYVTNDWVPMPFEWEKEQ
jgi:hypothetical protein